MIFERTFVHCFFAAKHTSDQLSRLCGQIKKSLSVDHMVCMSSSILINVALFFVIFTHMVNVTWCTTTISLAYMK